MQSLEVISVNMWQILISFLNLIILFLLVKKFLFGPVNNMLAKRQSELDERYSAADEANRMAAETRDEWNKKMLSVKEDSDNILKKAVDTANNRSSKILSDAEEKAENIISQAKEQAQLELEKAEDVIKEKIVENSIALADKILEREVNSDDHHNLINSFIEKLGDNDANE